MPSTLSWILEVLFPVFVFVVFINDVCVSAGIWLNCGFYTIHENRAGLLNALTRLSLSVFVFADRISFGNRSDSGFCLKLAWVEVCIVISFSTCGVNSTEQQPNGFETGFSSMRLTFFPTLEIFFSILVALWLVSSSIAGSLRIS